jgi:hypothetical protein
MNNILKFDKSLKKNRCKWSRPDISNEERIQLLTYMLRKFEISLGKAHKRIGDLEKKLKAK